MGRRLALLPSSRYSAAMDAIVRTFTTETTMATMISTTGIMIIKRMPAGRRVSR